MDIEEDLKRMATVEDYANIKSKMMQWEGMINKFRDEAIIHSQILRHYDEVIAQKASKVDVLAVEDQIHEQNKRFDVHGQVEKRVEALMARIEKMKKDNEMKFDMID